MRTVFKIMILLTSFGVMGCATLFKGGTEKVSFQTIIPRNAKVYVNGSFMGNTPLQLNLNSKVNYTIEFKAEGYESKTVLVNTNIGAGWVILDILGGLLPVVIDAATGNWATLDQTSINAALEKQL